jgi:EPS-associated MarR family transcriptional regulator
MQLNKDEFELLRKIDNKNNLSQRELAKNLGFSLGKLNYCLKGLVNKGFVKLNNFKNNKNKLNYVYLITPKGFSQKVSQTINFMNLKFREYDELKKEAEILIKTKSKKNFKNKKKNKN